HLAVGRAAEASGELEASGIRFPLTDTALSTLGLVVAHDAVVVAADLRPAPVATAAVGPAALGTGYVAELGPGPMAAGQLGPGRDPDRRLAPALAP
ncbi:MAG TPA: hypothetical protein PKE56_19155, partial [Acidimicrobiales bacterium]|nr:hypothetical protein [Acidimicrobiales bacterium]